jgi:hypothetical protein
LVFIWYMVIAMYIDTCHMKPPLVGSMHKGNIIPGVKLKFCQQ